MKHYLHRLSTITVFCMALCNCSLFQSRTDSLPPLNGVIYDKDNKKVENVSITVNGEHVTSSDINGHFALPIREQNPQFELTAIKEEYEPISITFTYTNPSQILYIQMTSANQLINLAESDITARKWESANNFLERSKKIGGDISAIMYLEAVIYSELNEPQKAESILIELITQGNEDPFIILFLADLYQYKLEDCQKALAQLHSFQSKRYDPTIESRINELEKKLDIE